jgi:DNA N-6-adenine-methyltransferase (Dam)
MLVKTSKTGNLIQFDPTRTKERSSVLDAAIMHARKMRDWVALKKAVDLQIKEQQKFVAWWIKVVDRPGGDQKSLAPIRANDRMPCDDAEAATGIRHQQVSRWSERLQDLPSYRIALFGPSFRKSMADEASLLMQQSISAEHYTPQKYIEAARSVLGAIDLDPASCAEANEIVKAAEFFDLADDGLAQPWSGRVWLNPPYGKLVGRFVIKLTDALKAGDVTQAIVLVNAHCTDTAWFQLLWDGCLCFTDHRINFFGDEARGGSTHGSVFIYFGNGQERFAKEFGRFGAVVARVP